MGQGKCWCDGVYLEEDNPEELTKIINEKKFLRIPISYGKSGQEPYTLLLYFGKKALNRNARGLDLNVCLPDFVKEPEYVFLDNEKKTLIIQLK